MKIKFTNRNPWQRSLPDCTIRAFSIALKRGYVATCKQLGVKCVAGLGMSNNGVGAASIKEILKKFKKDIRAYYIDPIYDKWWDQGREDDGSLKDDPNIDSEGGLDIDETMATLPAGRYVFFLRPSKKDRERGEEGWHSIFVKKAANNSESIAYDTLQRKDLGLVYGYAQMKPDAVSEQDSEWLNEMNQLYFKGNFWGDFVPPIFTRKEFENFKANLKKSKDQKQGKWFYEYMKKNQFDG